MLIVRNIVARENIRIFTEIFLLMNIQVIYQIFLVNKHLEDNFRFYHYNCITLREYNLNRLDLNRLNLKIETRVVI